MSPPSGSVGSPSSSRPRRTPGNRSAPRRSRWCRSRPRTLRGVPALGQRDEPGGFRVGPLVILAQRDGLVAVSRPGPACAWERLAAMAPPAPPPDGPAPPPGHRPPADGLARRTFPGWCGTASCASFGPGLVGPRVALVLAEVVGLLVLVLAVFLVRVVLESEPSDLACSLAARPTSASASSPACWPVRRAPGRE